MGNLHGVGRRADSFVNRAKARGVPARQRRPLRRATCWLAFLAPFFYITYGAANAVAAHRHDIPSIVFSWEHHVPFLAWTIVPYWSINAFYGLSVFACSTRAELDAHCRRLLTAQIVAVTCFILFPLRVTLSQPESHGIAGVLFRALGSFDKPFNQAPSLHIALLVILWPLYAKHVPRVARWPLHFWFVLVGTSVLTTYQHHFFDVPTGACLGLLCLWLWPEQGMRPAIAIVFATEWRRVTIAACYLIAAILIGALGVWISGSGLWLLWPAVSLALVAGNYALFGAEGFQKGADGRMSLAARLLLAPYLAGAFVNSRLWTWHQPEPVAVGGGVWLGRIPRAREAARFAAVVDLCAELPGAATAAAWTCIPMLDLIAPSPRQLREAVASIERGRLAGPVLVCCAVGYARSAAAVATWLAANNPAMSVSDAIESIRHIRPRIVVHASSYAAISMASRQAA
jgi:membrane-associated phospholipid phosphatase